MVKVLSKAKTPLRASLKEAKAVRVFYCSGLSVAALFQPILVGMVIPLWSSGNASHDKHTKNTFLLEPKHFGPNPTTLTSLSSFPLIRM